MPPSTIKSFSQLIKSAPKGRFTGVERPYTVEQVLRLRGSLQQEHTIATVTSNKLWENLKNDDFVPALGCLTGNQAVQCVRAGLKAIYLSGWQVAADANTGGDMLPDQSLYPCNSGPELAKRINKALTRADQIEVSETGTASRDWYRPIVADAEAGFGGLLNCYELMKAYIEAGVAGVHFEDQLGAEKKCGHMGGKVLIPTAQHIRHLNAARLAADVADVASVLICRTDAESARLLTSDIDERDHPFIDRAAGRTKEGFHILKDDGLNHSIMRALEFAPFSDLIWMETSTPNIEMAQKFADAVHKVYPDKMLSYNCSPSFNWGQHLSPAQLEKFQKELGAMGYKFQFITLAGFHVNNFGMFNLAGGYKKQGMAAYNVLQQQEFAAQEQGYTAVKHQREVGAGYFDKVAETASGGNVSTGALGGSTEQTQFYQQQRAMSTAASTKPAPAVRQASASDQESVNLETPEGMQVRRPWHVAMEK
jgi:isocitrate lyase